MKNILLGLLLITALSCTDNQRARKFGGDETIKLEAGTRLVTATWKESNLWFLVEPMPADYAPQTKVLHEASNFGVWQGTVVFIETR